VSAGDREKYCQHRQAGGGKKVEEGDGIDSTGGEVGHEGKTRQRKVGQRWDREEG